MINYLVFIGLTMLVEEVSALREMGWSHFEESATIMQSRYDSEKL